MRSLLARLQCWWATGHNWVQDCTGDALESWGHCADCPATYYIEPVPEVR